jgi:hypothetical protein
VLWCALLQEIGQTVFSLAKFVFVMSVQNLFVITTCENGLNCLLISQTWRLFSEPFQGWPSTCRIVSYVLCHAGKYSLQLILVDDGFPCLFFLKVETCLVVFFLMRICSGCPVRFRCSSPGPGYAWQIVRHELHTIIKLCVCVCVCAINSELVFFRTKGTRCPTLN